MSPSRRRWILALGSTLLLAACTSPTTGGGTSTPSQPSAPASVSGSVSPSGSPTLAPGTVFVSDAAQLSPAAGTSQRLGCALFFQGLPQGNPEVAIETIGRGAQATPTLHLGDQWQDGELTKAPREDQIIVYETIADPAGDYGCRVTSIGTASKSVPFTGETLVTTSPAVAPLPAVEFVTDFAAAIRSDDRAFLLDRLNPSVIDEYGSQTCTKLVAGLADPSFAMSLQRIRGPKDFTFSADGRSSLVPSTYEVFVSVTSDQGSGNAAVHYAQVGDHLTWFTDCGDPLP